MKLATHFSLVPRYFKSIYFSFVAWCLIIDTYPSRLWVLVQLDRSFSVQTAIILSMNLQAISLGCFIDYLVFNIMAEMSAFLSPTSEAPGRLGIQLSWLLFLVFLSPSMQISEWQLKLCHARFILHPLQLIIRYSFCNLELFFNLCS